MTNADASQSRRGRDSFQRASALIRIAEWVLRALPRALSRSLLSSMRNSNTKLSRARRYLAVRRIAASCGTLVDIRANCFLFAPEQMSIGSRVSIHPMCYLDATGGLTIGSDVSIAHGVSILTTEHVHSDIDIPIRDQGVTEQRVVIGSDVWIGAGVRVLAGVEVGDHSIVAAGAVVTKDIPPFSIAAGVPARVIRQRTTQP